MVIDAIVANIDGVWDRYIQSAEVCDEGEVLKRLLQGIKDEGYSLLLLSKLDAASLNVAISAALGPEGLSYFNAILSSRSEGDRYTVAMHTLATSPHRVMVLGTSESELQDARDFGIACCVRLSDALRDCGALLDPVGQAALQGT